MDEQGLGEAGHADKQRMAAREHSDQRLVDHLLLTIDDFTNGFAGLGDFRAGSLDFLNGVTVRFTECLH